MLRYFSYSQYGCEYTYTLYECESGVKQRRSRATHDSDRAVAATHCKALSPIDETPAAGGLARMREALNDDPGSVLVQCDEHIAHGGNHTFPLLLAPYQNLRPLLFQCLDILSLKSSSQDDALLKAFDWLEQYRSSRREYLLLREADLANLPLDWLPEKSEQSVFPHGRASRMLHRQYFELGVFSQVMRELNSGDVYVEGSDQFDDPREHQVSWDEFRE